MAWLFSNSKLPYRSSRNIRCVHLKMIKKKGFSEAHFDTSVVMFRDAMTKSGIAEVRTRAEERGALGLGSRC